MKNININQIKGFIEPYIAKASANEVFGSFTRATLITEPLIIKGVPRSQDKHSRKIDLAFIITTDVPNIDLLLSLTYNTYKNEAVHFISLERDNNNILAKSKTIAEKLNDLNEPLVLVNGFMSAAKAIEVKEKLNSLFFPLNDSFDIATPLKFNDLINTKNFKNLSNNN